MNTKKKECNRCNGKGELPCPGCKTLNESKSNPKAERHQRFNKISFCAGCKGKKMITCGVCGGSGFKQG